MIGRLNACLDAWLEVRVQAHRARELKVIGVPRYLELLRCVRAVEDVLDPWREELGATCSRAFELVTTDEQLVFEVAA